ncbi:MAG: phenylalanine--tRNA ligase subunit alpha, partial [Clostridiaceae bacterium]|nr:phenylalanine--tRNA ligase subunit alpha [Clostridiaceae bacterium]
MKQQLEDIRNQALAALNNVSDVRELDALKVEYLGKKGKLTQILKGMGKLSAEERPVVGQIANEVRSALEQGIQSAKERLN